jgi:amino acid transporter
LLVLFALINSFIGNANAGTIAASRIIFSLGRSGRLPAPFATIHPEHLTPSFAIYFQTLFSVVVATALGLAIGPVPAFTVLGALLTVFAIIIYMLTCVACIRCYAGKRNQTLGEIFVRLVCPSLAFVILIAPLYYQFVPWPDYPGNIGNYVAIIFVALAFAGMFFASGNLSHGVKSANQANALAADPLQESIATTGE